MNKHISVINSQSEIHSTGVYKIFHVDMPFHFYIGSTTINKGRKGHKGFAVRFGNHNYELRHNKHKSKKLQTIVDIHGLAGLRMEILELVEPSKCREREQYYLDTLKPCCNTFPSATGGKGFKHSEETRIKQSKARVGRVVSEETKRKISAAHKGKKPKNFATLHSPEINIKRGLALRGKKLPSYVYEAIRTPVYQFTKDRVLVGNYDSLKAAQEKTGINYSSISSTIVGRRPSAGGYLWSLSENLKAS